tara:strand:- start:24893 stop:25192 length:300 start_codon:yes stop_codon:yes gene_type:complete
MNAQEFKHIRKSTRLSQRDLGPNIGLSETEVRDIETEKMPLNRTIKQSLRNYVAIFKMREQINVVKARRLEEKISIMDFCIKTGMTYEEYKKWEEFGND